MLTYERAHEVLSYNKETGELRWKVQLSNRAPKGSIAGSLNKKENRWRVKIEGELFFSHRVIWLMMTGAWPDFEIDHKNRNSRDNSWDNLRDLTHQDNVFNRFEVGAYKHSATKWRTKLTFRGEVMLDVLCDSKEEAEALYARKKQQLLESL